MTTERELAEGHWALERDATWINIYQTSSLASWRWPFRSALRLVAPFASVLDLGCNCGATMPLFLDVSPLARVTGVDINRGSIERARTLYPEHLWFAASLPDFLPRLTKTSGQDRFDIVTATSVLGHMAPSMIDPVLTSMAALAKTAILIEARVAAPGYPEELTSSGVYERRWNYTRRFAALGWRLDHVVWHRTTDEPSGVMIFRPVE